MRKKFIFVFLTLICGPAVSQVNQDEQTKLANLHYNLAIQHINNNRYNDAIKELSEVLVIHPADPDALYNRGTMRFNIGDKTGACEDWHRLMGTGNHSADEMIKKYCTTNKKENTHRFYLRASAGYGLPLMPTTVAENIDVHYTILTNLVYEDHKAINTTLGKGVYGDISLGYKLNKIFNAELNIGYLKSANLISQQILHYYSGNATITDKTLCQLFTLKPSFVAQIPDEELSPYFRIGMIIGKPVLNREIEYSDYKNNSEYEKYEYTGKITLGGTAAFGCNINIKQNIDFFAEANVNYMVYAPVQRKMQAYQVNKKDSLKYQSAYKIQTITRTIILLNTLLTITAIWLKATLSRNPGRHHAFLYLSTAGVLW